MQTEHTDSDAYFRGPNDEKYFFTELCRRIHEECPEVLGQHISVQLEALGLLEKMQLGGTPFALPFTFADVAP